MRGADKFIETVAAGSREDLVARGDDAARVSGGEEGFVDLEMLGDPCGSDSLSFHGTSGSVGSNVLVGVGTESKLDAVY